MRVISSGFAATAAVLCIAAGPAHAQTPVSGTLGTELWTAADSPYLIQGDILLPAGETLTLEDGVTLTFEGAFTFELNGTISAVGTVANPITVNGSGWEQLHFNGADGSIENWNVSGGGTASSSSVLIDGTGVGLNVVNLSISGSSSAGLGLNGNASPTIIGLNVDGSATDGLVVLNNQPSFTLSGCAFTNNGTTGGEDYPLDELRFPNIAGLDTCSFSGNATEAIRITRGGTLSDAATWSAQPIPYLLGSAIYDGALLTLEAGLVVKWASSSTFDVRGTLLGDGSSSRILFTSAEDDSVGGDSTGNGSSSGTAGDWTGLVINQADASLTAVDIRYAGRGTAGCTTCANLYVFDNNATPRSEIILDDVELTDSANQGLALYNYVDVTLTDSTIVRTGQSNISYVNNNFPRILSATGNRFGDAGNYAIRNLRIDDAAAFVGNTFQNSGPDTDFLAMEITGGTLDAGTRTLGENVGGALVVNGYFNLGGNGTTSIAPGTVVKLTPAGGFYVIDHTFNLSGEEGNEIVFTSVYDDSYGGDTNGDDDATTPDTETPWYYIAVNNNSTLSTPANLNVDWTRFRYGGRGGQGMVWVRYDVASNVTIEDSIFERSAASGYYASSVDGDTAATTIEIHRTLFADNALSGVAGLSDAGRLSVQGCTFRNNGNYAIANVHAERMGFIGRRPDAGFTAPNLYEDPQGTGFLAVLVNGGRVDSSGVWGNDVPIVLRGFLEIGSGATVDVEGGTTIKFDINASFYPFDGTLNFNGTSDDPILVTSIRDDSGGDSNGDGDATAPSPGDWLYIYLNNDNTATADAQVNFRMTHTTVRFGGRSVGAVWSRFDPTYVTIEDSRIEDSATAGLYVSNAVTGGSEKRINVRRTVFEDNAGAGIDFANSGRASVQGSTFRDNGGWAIDRLGLNRLVFMGRLPSGDPETSAPNTFVNTSGSTARAALRVTSYNPQTVSGTWPNDAPIVIATATQIQQGAVIEIDPGAVVKFDGSNSQIYVVDGEFHANGGANPGEEVVFTSILDDDYGGDTNGDGAATDPLIDDGYWAYIYLNDNNTSSTVNDVRASFTHSLIRFGGSTNGAVVVRYEPTWLTLDDTIVEHSATNGIQALSSSTTGDSRIIIRNSTFRDNALSGIDFQNSGKASVQGSSFVDNGDYAINNLHLNRLAFMGRLPTGDPGGPAAPNTFSNTDGSSDHLAIRVAADAGSTVSGTWPNDAPIVIDGTPTIYSNAVIDVEPGAIFKFQDTGAYLYVQDGVLNVNGGGTEETRVVFTSLLDDTIGGDTNADDDATSPFRGSWRALYFNNNNTPSTPANGVIRNADFRWGGAAGDGNVALRFEPTNVLFEDSTFRESASGGVYITFQGGEGSEKRLQFHRCSFRDNQGPGIELANSGKLSIQGSDFGDNGNYAIFGASINRLNFIGRLPDGDSGFTAPNTFSNGDSSADFLGIHVDEGDAANSGPWPNDAPIVWRVTGNIVGNAKIDLEPGIIIKFVNPGDWLYVVDGILNAIGTGTGDAQKIVFTSIQDDTAGGDTNGDDGATEGLAGQWDAIYFNNNNTASTPALGTFRYAELRYGGNQSSGMIQIRNDPTFVTIEDTLIEHSASEGVDLLSTGGTEAAPRVALRRVTIRDTADSGVLIRSNDWKLLEDVSISDTGSYAIDGLRPGNESMLQNPSFPGSDRFRAIRLIGGSVASGASTRIVNHGVPWVFGGSYTVNDGADVVFEANTIVKMEGSFLNIQGDVDFESSPGNEIIFTSALDDAAGGDSNGDGPSTPAPADWQYVDLSGIDTLPASIHDVILRYGGSSFNAMFYSQGTQDLVMERVRLEQSGNSAMRMESNGTLEVRNSQFLNNAEHGIWQTNGSPVTIESSVFGGNTGFSLYQLHPTNVDDIVSGNTWDTARPGINLRGGTVPDGFVVPNVGVPLIVDGAFSAGGSLEISPGVTFKVASNQQVRAFGPVRADANGAASIVFTSYADDLAGGDSNADPTPPTAGDWHSFRLFSGEAVLRNVVFRYSGTDPNYGALSFEGASPITVEDVQFSSNARGIFCNQPAAASIAGSTFTGNDIGIYLSNCSDPVIGGTLANRNSFVGNATFAIQNVTAPDVNARNNYWGSRDGPTHPGNPGGDGDPVSDNVDYGTFVTVTADAGDDVSVTEEESASLDGTRSFDPDGLEVTYLWSQVAGTPVTLSSNTAAQPSFLAPSLTVDEVLTFQLVVSAASVTSVPDTVDVTVVPINDPPTANAGPDRTTLENEVTFLVGGGSDINDDALVAYSWSQVSGPAVALNDSGQATAWFRAPEVGSDTPLTFALVVTDEEGADSSPDSVVITVTPGSASRVVGTVSGDANGFDYLAGVDEVVIGETVTLEGTGLDSVTSVRVNGRFQAYDGDNTELTFPVAPGTPAGPMNLELNGIPVPEADDLQVLELGVVANTSDTVSIIDAASGAALHSVTVTPSTPDFGFSPVDISPSGKLAVVGRSRTGSPNEIGSEINLITGTVDSEVSIDAIRRLTAFDFLDDRRVVFADSCFAGVGVVDFDSGSVVANLQLGPQSFANADVAAVPGSELVFVPLPGFDEVSVLTFDGTSLNELDRIDWSATPGGGNRPISVAASPDGRFVLVANADSASVSTIEITGPTSYTVRPTTIPVAGTPYVVRFSEGSDLAAVAVDGGALDGDDSLLVLRAAVDPEPLGAVDGLTFTAFFDTDATGGCTAAAGTDAKNTVAMLQVSYDGQRIFLGRGGRTSSTEYAEIRLPNEFPAVDAVVTDRTTVLTTEGIAVQPGGTVDSIPPTLVAARLDDGDGLIEIGAGDWISLIYSEPISTGTLAGSLATSGTLSALVAQLGSFDSLGTLSASASTLSVSDRRVTITLGGAVSGSLEPGGLFTPLAGSIDDAAGNVLSDTTPIEVSGSFTGPFDPTYVASQGADNNTIVLTFSVPMLGTGAATSPSSYDITYSPGLSLGVSSVNVISGTRFELSTDAPLFVGTEYAVVIRPGVVDQVNGLNANPERSETTFVAVDRDAPSFAGLTSAIDAASVSQADGAVLLSWGPASDNDTATGSIRYRIYWSNAVSDPFASGFLDTVEGVTTATVTGLVSGQSYRFGVRAEDTAGNREQNTVTRTVTPSDGLAPTWNGPVGVTSVRNTFAGGTLAITYGRATDISSNPVLGSSVSYNVYVSPGLGSLYNTVYANIGELDEFEITGLTDGIPYLVAVRAVDAAGNEEDNDVALTETPTFDATPPTFAGITSALDAGTDGRTVTVSWDPAAESSSPPIRYRLFYTDVDPTADLSALLFNEGATPGAEPARVIDNIDGTSRNVGNLNAGTTYWFGVRARDGAFNFDGNTAFRTASPSPDTDPPVFAGIQSAVATGTFAQVRVTWDEAVDAKSPPVRYQLFYADVEAELFDQVRETRNASARQWVSPSLTPNVTHFFAVRACDARDNCTTNAERLSAVPLLDTTAPTFAGITVGQPGASNTVDLFWGAATEELSPPVLYEVFISDTEATLFDQTPVLANGASRTCASGVTAQFCATEFAGAPLENGVEYWFGVRAVDQAGNNSLNTERDPATPEDTVAPTISNLTIQPNPATVGDVVRIGFTVSEVLGADPAVELETTDAGTTVAAVLASKSGLDYVYEYGVTGQEDEGTRPIAIRAVDQASNSETLNDTVLLDFTRDLTAPIVSFVSPKADDVVNQGRPTITVDLTDPEGTTEPTGIDCSTIELFVDNQRVFQGCTAFDSIIETGWLQPNADGADRLAYTPPVSAPLATGVHSVEIRVRDFDGNAAAPSVITFNVVPPDRLVINPSAVQLTALESQVFTVSWDRSTDGCVWSSQAAGGPTTPSVGPETTYQTSTNTPAGRYQLSVTCTDIGATRTATATIDVLNLLAVEPFRPTLSPGDEITFRAVSDLSGGTYSWQLSGGGTLTAGVTEQEIRFTAGLIPGNDFIITVTDTSNNVTASTPIQILPDGYDLGKAIIVAGGTRADHLWPDTRNLSEYAYEVLRSRGLSDERIYFLSQPGERDIDDDGFAEVDAEASLSALDGLEYAVTTWAQQDAESDSPLFIYLVDHGGTGSMWLNDANGSGVADGPGEILTVETLQGYLDTLPSSRPVTVFYEACKAGSFIAPLAGPNRVLLTSAGNENATIAVDGNISLSQYFFSAIASGRSVGESLGLASAAMTVVSAQIPRLDDDGDGAPNGSADGLVAEVTYLGFPFSGDRLGLEIAAVSARNASEGPVTTGDRARVEARVEGPAEITTVYALLVAPDYVPAPPSDPFETPEIELDLPRVTLELDEDSGLYVGFSDTLTLAGDYRFLVYASDVEERQALPRLATLAIENAPPALVTSVPANGQQGVPVNQSLTFVLEDDEDGVDRNATQLLIDGIDVTDEVSFSGTQERLTVFYEVTPANEWPPGTTVNILLRSADAGDPPISAAYPVVFTTPGALFTRNHTPARNAAGVAGNTSISVEVFDPSGFGIDPSSLSMRVNGSTVGAFIQPCEGTAFLECFRLVYSPPLTFADGETVDVEIRAADLDARAMPTDRYQLFIGPPLGLDTEAPMLTEIEPADGAQGVSLSTTVRFVVEDDLAVNPSSLRAATSAASGSQSYASGDGNLVCSADLVLQARRFECVLTPRIGFQAGDIVTVRIDASDQAGNAMPQAVSSFTVPNDTRPPSYTVTSPVVRTGAPSLGLIGENVPVNRPIEVRVTDFESGVDLSTLRMSVNGAPVSPTVSGVPSSALMRWAGPFDYGTRYEVVVDATDLAGNAMATGRFSYVTDPGLLVVSASPLPNASGISVDTRVSLTVQSQGDRVVDLDSVRLRVASGDVVPVQTGTPSNLVLDYQPPTSFAYGSTVQVSLDLRDERGNAIPTYRFEFDTVQDVTPPRVTNQSPAPDATGVSADSTVSFSVVDDEAGVRERSIEAIVDGDFYSDGDPGFATSAIAGGFRVTITPPVNAFASGDEILVAVTASDTAGNESQSAYTFRIGNEGDEPEITIVAPSCPSSTFPGGDPVGVPTQSQLAADISDVGAGVDLDSVRLELDLGSPFDLSNVRLNGDGRDVRASARPGLLANTTYSFTVFASDLSASGNPTSASLSFTTTDEVDGDGDQMPDDYEVCFFDEGAAALASGDADDDGATNLQEYRDGTNPRNPNDVISTTPDEFEVDDQRSLARTITPSGAEQVHNFHQANDPDWVRFTTVAGQAYRVATSALQGRSDTILSVQDEAGNTIAFNNDSDPSGASEVIFSVPEDAIELTYYALVQPTSPDGFGAFTGYTLGVYQDSVPPAVSEARPEDGATLVSVTPIVSATIVDDNSGVDPTSVDILIDGNSCGPTFEPTTGAASCTPTEPLAVGSHIATFLATDVAGNRAEARTIFTISDFAIDPSSVRVLAGAAPVTFTVSGGTEPIRWEATGGILRVSDLDGRDAEFTPGAVAGLFEVSATDASGQRRDTARIEIAPVLSITPALLNLAAGESAELTANGTGPYLWSAPEALSLSDDSGASVTVTAATTPGAYSVTVTDEGTGNSATATVSVVTSKIGEVVLLAASAVDLPEDARAIRRNAESAYRALVRRGFSRDRIHFYSDDPGADFDGDGNGVADDIDGTLDVASLNRVFRDVLPSRLDGSSPLTLVYVGGRSGPVGLDLGQGERFRYDDLATSLDGLTNTPGLSNLRVILDTDRTGDVHASLRGRERIVITSTESDELANFAADGQRSFSFAFWNRIFLGESIGEAYSTARGTLQVFGDDQTPRLEDDGDGTPDGKGDGALAQVTYIGEPGLGNDGAPIVTRVTEDLVLDGGTNATLFAEVSSSLPLASVTATVIPPELSGDAPLVLTLGDTGSRYEASFPGFARGGVYRVIYLATDIQERVSRPVESTVTTAGPYVDNLYPAPDSVGAATNSRVYFSVRDASAGLDLGTLSVTIDGVGASCAGQGDYPRENEQPSYDDDPRAEYVECVPANGFSPSQVVPVTLDIENVNGVALSTVAYSFVVTDENDIDADGLPEDFQDFLGEGRKPGEDVDGDSVLNGDEFTGGLNPIEITGEDAFEDDDTFGRATAIGAVGPTAVVQRHTFHDRGDRDWVSFQCEPRVFYEIATRELEARADTVIDFTLPDGTTVIRTNDDYALTGGESRIFASCPRPGVYAFRITSFDPEVFGPSTGYTLTVSRSEAPIGSVFGAVEDGTTGAPITSAFIVLDIGIDTLETRPFPDGAYLIDAPPGSRYVLSVTAPGYRELVIDDIEVLANSFVAQPLILDPDGIGFVDTDMDGLPDAYEEEVGLDPNDPSDASLDPDMDGRTTFEEYLGKTNPFVSNAPSAVVFKTPSDGGDALAPLTVTVFNSVDPDGDPVGYDFELSSDDGLTTLDQSDTVESGPQGESSWVAAAALSDGTFYRVRASATDGVFRSPTTEIRVRIVLSGQPPPIPVLFAPEDGSTVRTPVPSLEVVTVSDLDGDATSYDFEVYSDAGLTDRVAQVVGVLESPGRTEWQIAPPLSDLNTYFWRARALDATGLVSEWSAPFSFQIDLSNAPPPEPVITSPASDGEIFTVNPPTIVFTGVQSDIDGESVTYRVQIDADPAFQSGLLQVAENIVVNADGEGRFTPSGLLTPNLTYYVRVAGNDGLGFGDAAERSFSVAEGAGAAVPSLLRPTNLAGVSSLTPELVAATLPASFGELRYEFEVYADLALEDVVATSPGVEGSGDEVSWTVTEALTGGEVYYWRVRTLDAAGNPGGWSEVGAFFVDVGVADGGCACDDSEGPGLWCLLLALGMIQMLLRRRRSWR